MIPTKYFVTSGSGKSDSPINAFDLALKNAGIAQCNLVPVSSIIPSNAKRVEFVDLPPGKITHCVMAKGIGKGKITAGIGWGFIEGDEKKYGIVTEHVGKNAKKKLIKNLERMASIRKMKLVEYKTKIESISTENKDEYGCAIAALIYLE